MVLVLLIKYKLAIEFQNTLKILGVLQASITVRSIKNGTFITLIKFIVIILLLFSAKLNFFFYSHISASNLKNLLKAKVIIS